ncbi:MAG TPA: hypothetical protein VFT24_11750 [Vicinamibacterales bacterium]|nr:hypothetical protein [Vicinamibacterales bacterium]
MKTTSLRFATALTVLLAAVPAAAQQGPGESAPPATVPAATVPAATDPAATPTKAEEEAKAAEESWKKGRTMRIQYLRPMDKRGLNVFETTKEPGAEFKGFAMDFGAAFTSQIQNLSHENRATPNIVNGSDVNKLQNIGFGFNNSTANAVLHAQLAPGIRVQLTSYLSARHHNETWVKDGYIQIDQSPIDVAPLKMLFEIATVRIGHMEINYGDAHFRRTDNGNAIYNPFVGNYILDAFTTEIGGEVYLKVNGLIAMGALTAGELRGTVLTPEQRGPSLIGKLGFDRQVNDQLRVRLTGSMYRSDKGMSNTLYSGDRAGSRYYWVMENTAATESANYTSGAINPGFKNKVQAFQMNPFVKYRHLEVFGVLERAEGKASAELDERVWKQYAVDAVYRFLPDDAAYFGVRYNKATGTLTGISGDVGANRWQASGGWFVTANILAKAEYVDQKYVGFPATNIRNGGRFKGFMLEGVVAF